MRSATSFKGLQAGQSKFLRGSVTIGLYGAKQIVRFTRSHTANLVNTLCVRWCATSLRAYIYCELETNNFCATPAIAYCSGHTHIEHVTRMSGRVNCGSKVGLKR